MNTNIRTRRSFSLASLFILCACVLALFSCSSESSSPSQSGKSYTVTFDANGGTPVSTFQKVDSGNKLAQPAIPKRDRYVFTGWFTDKQLAVRFDFKDAIDRDIVLYAGWSAPLTNSALGDILKAGVIPQNIASATDDVVKEIFALYSPGASLVVKHLKPGATGDGSSWSKAAGNIKAVMDGITDASQNKIYLVLLAVGEYKIREFTKENQPLFMKNNVAIVGGFAGTADQDYTAVATVDATTLSGEGAPYSVIYNAIENVTIDSSALLYRLNIANGRATSGGGMINFNSSPKLMRVNFTNNSAPDGGAIANKNSSPILINVNFTNNSASNSGGAIVNQNSSPILTNVTFSKNSANGSSSSSGGAMLNDQKSSPILKNVRFDSNWCQFGGGAMGNQYSSPILTNVTFVGNYTTGDLLSGGGGGAIGNVYSSPILTNVTFVGNSANGGGAMANVYSSPILTNVTFVGNFAYLGGSLYNAQSMVTAANCIFWGNTSDDGSAERDHEIFLDTNSSIFLYHSVLQGGKRKIGTLSFGSSTMNTDLILSYVNMDTTDPGLAADIADNGGFVPTLAITNANSSAKDIGLYAKRVGSTLYLSENNSSWFTIDSDGSSKAATIPPNAIDLATTDARGYGRVGRPDAGAYEEGAGP